MMKLLQQQFTTAGGLVLLFALTGCSMLEQEKDDGLAGTVPALTLPPFEDEASAPPPAQSPPGRQANQTATRSPAPAQTKTRAKTKAGAQTQKTCGNEPQYTLKGKTYRVLPSARGYRAEGTATWYGAEYQNSPTAGCETFDMHAFTAAHRTLPLPSFVRVTNLENNKSVLVRVNDRGPFENDGLIQLSFAAANTLGMTQSRREVKVRVEALDKQPGSNTKAAPVARGAASRTRTVARNPRQAKQVSPAQQGAIQRAKQRGESYFVVVRNYPDQAQALEMFVRLTSVGLTKTEMASARSRGRKMHQVRIGPLYTQDQIDNVTDTLENNGLATFKVVKVNQ